ncbi:MAG: MmcQ/YjbR family DNA-binding protein [Clostridia bacterium]|nr:MmcQ/YjbR family DNA-binding protein [Clostridia bacterium]
MTAVTMREQIYSYVKEKYSAKPEFLWARYPDCAVFRHADNRKWFGIIMDVRRSRLGLEGDDLVDVLNVKLSDPMFADFLARQPGYCRAYHMNKRSWVSVLLDGSVPFEDITWLIDESYLTTAPKEKKKKLRPPKEWIVPSNPKYYDIQSAFDRETEIHWKQGAGIKTGDTVYMYVAAPVSAILYKCAVTETDIPCEPFSDGRLRVLSLMNIRLEKRYSPDDFTFETLGREYGIFAVRGPRGIPENLSRDLNR